MENNSQYQARVFLTLLDDTEENSLAKLMLKSPIGLSYKILDCLFTNQSELLKDNLDEIKGFSAGVTSSRNKSSGYKIASYYEYLFSFHQFVHSSYRARQGKVLEQVLDNILKVYCGCEVPNSANKKLLKLIEICKSAIPKHDIDSFGLNEELSKVLVIQIRSRDDTGGATAKGSLVELLIELIKLDIHTDYEITYLVVIWVALDSNQKKTTIRKFYDSIKNVTELDEDKFFEDILIDGYRFNEKLILKLDYGLDQFADTLKEWTETEEDFSNKIDLIIERIENWDDLWISYAIGSLEIEIQKLNGKNNIDILKEKIKLLQNTFDFSSYKNLVNSIDLMTTELITIWDEDTLPVKSPSDSALYLRDLLFLFASYLKITGNVSDISQTVIKDFS